MASENLIINGTGNYPGGRYDKISIRGEGTITQEVECGTFRVYGTSEVRDNILAKSVRIMGETEIKGSVDAKETVVMGTMVVDQAARLETVKVYGLLEVGDKLSGEKADIKGSISVKGDVEYEVFDSRGGFEVKGLLSADTMKVVLSFGDSFAEEIGGGKITVRRGSWMIPFTNISLSKKTGNLTAKVIEGDDIYLENTKADIVRGKKVKIGPGCEIGEIEYI